MCLAVPAEIVEIDHDTNTAIVSLEGVRKQASLALLETADIGDFVLLHVGFALSKISAEEAQKTLQMMDQACRPVSLVNPSEHDQRGHGDEVA